MRRVSVATNSGCAFEMSFRWSGSSTSSNSRLASGPWIRR
jgi:hypothetical protein